MSNYSKQNTHLFKTYQLSSTYSSTKYHQQPKDNDFIKRFYVKTFSNNNKTILDQNQSDLSHNTQQTQNQINRMSILIYQNEFKVRIINQFYGNNYVNYTKENDQNIKKQNHDNNDHLNQIVDQKRIDLNQKQSNNHTYKQHQDIYFETVPYDAYPLSFQSAVPQVENRNQNISNLIITSNRSMPVRIYRHIINSNQSNKQNNQPQLYCTFNDHKPNSQLFLAPYQFDAKDKTVIGVGKKFCNIYDCIKIKTTRIKAFDKIHLSTVEVINSNTSLLGDFLGKIYFLDIREPNQHHISSTFKPHVDAVFHLKHFPSNDKLFISSARKDNFTYIFDIRNLSTFVNSYEFVRNSNQRYGLDVKHNTFAIGGENGQIYINNINDIVNNADNLTSQQTFYNNQTFYSFHDNSNVNITDISIDHISDNNIQISYSCGTRVFEECQQYDEVGKSKKSIVQNKQKLMRDQREELLVGKCKTIISGLKSFTFNFKDKIVKELKRY